MSFAEPKRIIQEGDSVILYLSVINMHILEVKSKIPSNRGVLIDNVFQCNYGALKLADLVGKEFGTKIQMSRGFGYVLQLNPELWTMNLPHRTQILYTPDISMIIMELDVKPGSIVIEAGTGSGSLSHAFIRAIKENGHLYTFDFHEARSKTAREEFAKHGFGDFVTAQHRDVCSDGFNEELNGKADAIFLDLPNPYVAIKHAVRALKPTGSRFCGFSPCIEQSQATCEELEKYGFFEISTIELLQSEHIVKEKNISSIDLSFVKDKRNEEDSKHDQPRKDTQIIKKVLTTHHTPIQTGHTGYLTFATYLNLNCQ